jgi:3-oxoacyl-[acyl-carrier-protein] synthase III
MKAYINGLGTFFPNSPVSNDRMEEVLGKINGEESWARPIVLDSCGIVSRHYALDRETGAQTHTNAQMTALAVKAALENGGYSEGDLELLASGTATPDQLNPGHASMAHGELKSRPMETVSFGGFCGSGMSALRYAYLSVASGQRRLAAATGSELSSAVLRASRFKVQEVDVDAAALRENPVLSMNKEFLRWIAADGAGCAVVAPEPRQGGVSLSIDWLDSVSLAHEYETCMYHGGEKDRRTGALRGWLAEADLQRAVDRNYFCITQDVALLKKSVISAGIHRVLKDVVEARGLRTDMYDWFLPHLSSFFFKGPLSRAMSDIGFAIPDERWFTNLDVKGNLGSASMYAILDQGAREGRFQRGQKILCGVPESGRFSYFYMQLTVV